MHSSRIVVQRMLLSLKIYNLLSSFCFRLFNLKSPLIGALIKEVITSIRTLVYSRKFKVLVLSSMKKQLLLIHTVKYEVVPVGLVGRVASGSFVYS